MSRWSAGRRWGLVAWSLLLLVVAAVVAIYAGLYNIAADVPTPNRSIGYLIRYGNARSQLGHGTLLFQTIWVMRTASQKVQANMRRCAVVAILRRA
jgi:hypothetical protein